MASARACRVASGGDWLITLAIEGEWWRVLLSGGECRKMVAHHREWWYLMATDLEGRWNRELVLLLIVYCDVSENTMIVMRHVPHRFSKQVIICSANLRKTHKVQSYRVQYIMVGPD